MVGPCQYNILLNESKHNSICSCSWVLSGVRCDVGSWSLQVLQCCSLSESLTALFTLAKPRGDLVVSHNTSENTFSSLIENNKYSSPFHFSMLGIFLVRNSCILPPPTPSAPAQCKAQGCGVALTGLTNSGGAGGGQAALLHATMPKSASSKVAKN